MRALALLAALIAGAIALEAWLRCRARCPRRALQRLRALLLRSRRLAADHADVVAVLRTWRIVPSEGEAHADPATRTIRMPCRVAGTPGALYDDETLLLVLLHELAHAARARAGHDAQFFSKEAALRRAVLQDGLLREGAEVSMTYPARLLRAQASSAA